MGGGGGGGGRKWDLVLVLLLAQLVSLLMAIGSFTSSLLAELGVDTPLTQSFFTYSSLAVVFGAIVLCRRQKLLVPWYWYLALAIIDVQGNYLVVKAYQYSSITSVTLLDCCTVVWVVLLTRLVIGTRYSIYQIFGAAICVSGLILVLYSDAWESSGDAKKPLLGDVLVIAGTVFFAFSNVGEEFCAKKKDIVEVLAMLGVFGVLTSACEISLLERKSLESIKWSATIILLFAGFALAMFMFYAILPLVLKMSGATLFNLSLLTSDMWVVLIRIFFYHQKVDWLYFVAFGVVAAGLVIYSVKLGMPRGLDVLYPPLELSGSKCTTLTAMFVVFSNSVMPLRYAEAQPAMPFKDLGYDPQFHPTVYDDAIDSSASAAASTAADVEANYEPLGGEVRGS